MNKSIPKDCFFKDNEIKRRIRKDFLRFIVFRNAGF